MTGSDEAKQEPTPKASSNMTGRSESQEVIPQSLRFGIGVVLTALAGFIDAVGFIELGGFFASFMSGASISVGVNASTMHTDAMYHALLLVTIFVVAATASSVISGMIRPWGIPAAIALEGTCLSGALLMIESNWPSSISIMPVVAAMGVQNTALQPIHGVRLGVTFMTGTLVSLSQALGGSVTGNARPWSWTPHALIWCLFVAGAAAGAMFHKEYGFAAIAVPTLAVWLLGLSAFIAVFLAVRKEKAPEGA
ncbi:YoaK family protein [Pseudaminobacter salicylatoxidans]|uniref:YoaK family protein n=1 Tax=Pseudaminobacter salicylatoxidans TaxID=93369 RepID=UPI000379B198|nr:YoaK family protein [Pseudaminobacter salicylatoxidans]